MSKQLSIRFLIGLGDPPYFPTNRTERYFRAMPCADHVPIRRVRAHGILERAYDFGAFFEGEGLWQGTLEACLTFEVILDDSPDVWDQARRLAAEIRDALGQEAVGLVFTPVDMETI